MNTIITKEGFSIKKMRHFPSLECGENGGTSCSILLHGKKIADFLDVGDGGDARVTWVDKSKRQEYEDLVIATSARLEPEEAKRYGMDIIRMCAVSSLVAFLDDAKENLRLVLKWKAKGYPFTLFASLQRGFKVATLGCKGDIDSEDAKLCKKSLAEFLKVKEDDPAIAFRCYEEASFTNL